MLGVFRVRCRAAQCVQLTVLGGLTAWNWGRTNLVITESPDKLRGEKQLDNNSKNKLETAQKHTHTQTQTQTDTTQHTH